MIKTIYLAKRHPATSYDEFVDNWRQHAVLSGSFPEVGRRFTSVIQCRRVLADLPPELGLRQDFDGANLLGLTSLFDAADVYNQDGIATLRQDERRVFSDYVSESSMTGVEHVLLDGERQGVVLLDLVTRRPGDDRRDFLLGWTGRYARELMRTGSFREHVRRYVHNQIVLPTPANWSFDGIAELWFDDLPDAVSYLEKAGGQAPAGDFEPGFRTLLEVSHRWIRRVKPRSEPAREPALPAGEP